jgi:hypothetical protein
MTDRALRLKAATVRSYSEVASVYLVNPGKICNIAVGTSDRDG